MAERSSIERALENEQSKVKVRTRRLGGDTTNRIDFWVDQLNQLRRAKAASLPGDEIIAELDKQITATMKQIEDLGGDLSALSPEKAGANFVEPTNVTVEEVKPKAASAAPEGTSRTTAQLSRGEVAKTSGVALPEPDLGRRQIRASGSRSLGVGAVGDLAGTMDLEGTADDLARSAGFRTAAKGLGVLALPIGIMSELEGKPLGDPNEPAYIAIARAVSELPAFKTASLEERSQMMIAATNSARDMMAKVVAERLANAQAPQAPVGGLRNQTAARPYVAGGEVPPEIQEEADRQVPPQPQGPQSGPMPAQPQPTPQAATPPQTAQTTSAAPTPQEAPPQSPQGVAAQVGLAPDQQDPNAPAPQGVAAPPANDQHYQTNASGDGRIFEDEWPQTPGQRPQPTAAQGVAAPPQQDRNYAQTKQSPDMDKQEWADLLGRMKQKGIKGFNFGGYAFHADDDMPSGYRVIYDRGVAKNRPEGVDRKENK